MTRLRNLFLTLVFIALAAAIVILGLQVMDLIPQVQQEQQRTPTPSPVYGNVMAVTPDPSQPTAVPVVRSGSSGPAVRQLQERLLELGYQLGEADGVFGTATENALITFQVQNGLDPDGVAGAATNTVLYSSSARAYVAPSETQTPTPESTATPEVRSESQEQEEKEKMYITADGFPLLVNREHLLPDDYEPYELVDMKRVCDEEIVKIKYEGTLAEKEAVDALLIMLSDAIDQGLSNWQVSAAYRTVAQQKKLFDNRVRSYMNDNGLSRTKAISATRRTVADPGSSEHHLGTAFDITVPGASFGSTRQAQWMADHCWDYGFILRYTEEKQSITGFLAEPWHFRYVGVIHSRIMQMENLCLEEYIDQYGNTFFEDEVEEPQASSDLPGADGHDIMPLVLRSFGNGL